ncbi:MAG: hypothetical protein ABII07_02450 [Patescibacteria group bacterium]|nr:hypothetical protein [Patescibacteria group bacterium]
MNEIQGDSGSREEYSESFIEEQFSALIEKLRTSSNNLRIKGPFTRIDGVVMWHFYAEAPRRGSTMFTEIRYSKDERIFRGFLNGVLNDFDEDGFRLESIEEVLGGLEEKFT